MAAKGVCGGRGRWTVPVHPGGGDQVLGKAWAAVGLPSTPRGLTALAVHRWVPIHPEAGICGALLLKQRLSPHVAAPKQCVTGVCVSAVTLAVSHTTDRSV